MKIAKQISIAVMLLSSYACSADTIKLMRIDGLISNITYNNYSSILNGAQYTIQGTFEMRFIEPPQPQPWIIPIPASGNLRLQNFDLTVGALPDIDFSLPTYASEITGSAIIGDTNPCTWETTPGTCISAGKWDAFTGIFDGNKLTLTGKDYLSLHSSPNYSYSIVATVVPLPGSFILFLSGVVTLLFSKNKSLSNSSKGSIKWLNNILRYPTS